MTPVQAAHLQVLSRAAREPEAFVRTLSKEAAARRIDVLRAKLRKDKSGAQHKPE